MSRAAQAAAPRTRSTAPGRLWPLLWPLYLELLLGIAVGVAGTALAARLSDTSGAAFAMAHHVFGTVFIVFRIIGAGVGVVVTQALGAQHRQAADDTARAALGASTWLGGGLATATALGAVPLLRLLNAPPEVLQPAAMLLVAMAPAMALDAWNATGAAVMRAHLRARDTLMVMLAMHGTHLVLVGPLMFGVGGWPGLGLPGFAMALLVARSLAVLLHRWLWIERLQLRPQLGDLWHLRGPELRAIARIGAPGAAENIAWRLGFMASIRVVATLGSVALATHAYVHQLMVVILLFGLATGLAAEVLVGHQIGAGHFRAAHRLVARSLARGIAVSVTIAVVAALSGSWLLHRFTRDERIVSLGCTLLWWTVLLEPGRTFNLVVGNALRATGDARYPVVAGAGSMLVVLAGGSWLLGSDAGFGLGLVGVWIAYTADEWVRGLLMWRRWVTLRWVPLARASRRRLTRPAPDA